MVRRRVVIALRPAPDTDVAVVRGALEQAAARSHVVLVAVSPDVLDAATLEELSPELVLALPPGRTVADAAAVVAAGSAGGRALPGVEGSRVATVLVHDLRFEVTSSDPQRLSRSIAREGILSDALGSYTSVPGQGRLAITYTGPLLSDELVAVGAQRHRPPGRDPARSGRGGTAVLDRAGGRHGRRAGAATRRRRGRLGPRPRPGAHRHGSVLVARLVDVGLSSRW